MTIKYLFIIGDVNIDKLLPFAHIPVDSYIYETVKSEINIKSPKISWSRMDDYKVYLKYQMDIRILINIYPLRWEFKSWSNAIKNEKGHDIL